MAQLHAIDPVGVPMMELAGRLGSDVPFLLAATAGEMEACIARGRGEILEPISAGGDLNFVIHYPPIPLSTAEVYRKVADEALVAGITRVEQTVSALRMGSAGELSSKIFNRLQEPACRLEPRLRERLKWIEQLGSRGAWVTGSGSSCYGLAQSNGHARRMARNLAGRGNGLAMVARPRGRTTQREIAA
jgi:4-diphosphocytidyl-2-C-methyl-D-erythritol kinase